MPYRRLGEPWPSLGGLGLGTPIGGGASIPTYAEILRDTYGANRVYPLVDISSGTTITELVASDNGTLVGWDLQNAAGPVTGTLAPYSDGTNDYGNILTASHQAAFDGTVGSLFMWCNKNGWSDGAGVAFYIRTDGNNYIQVVKNASQDFRILYDAGGTLKNISLGTGMSGWFSFGLSWKDASNGDEVKMFLNGSQSGATQTSNGDYAAGNPGIMLIGAASSTPGVVLDGWLAYCAVLYGSIWTPTDFSNMHAAAATAGAD